MTFRYTMKRRQYLRNATVAALLPSTSATAVSATKSSNRDEFKRIIKGTFNELPDERKDLELVLEQISHEIHQNFEPLTWESVSESTDSLKSLSANLRRTERLIGVLHQYDTAIYIEDDWVALARGKIGPVVRYLPLLGSFNNLYESAERLDIAVKKADSSSREVEPDEYEQFAFALLAFTIEIGLFQFGAPYKMAWRGTRFVSNRTLLRLGRHVDSKLIALAMSELHWKIRETIYEEVNKENLSSSLELITYLLSELSSLEDFAEQEGISQKYMNRVNLDLSEDNLREIPEIKKRLEESGPLGGFLDGILKL